MSALGLLLASGALFILGAEAAWPIKTIDHSNRGADCDPATEQYLQVEGYDFHEKPKFTLHWRQIAGPCGKHVASSDLKSWSATYDSTKRRNPDEGPGRDGRVQLNIFVCAPFGHYEIDLDIESESKSGTSLQARTAWEIEDGQPGEYHIWDTVNTDLKNDEDYSPTMRGFYTWPLEGETGYYKTLYAGPLPPLECSSSVPSGTTYKGCFKDSSSDRLLNSASTVRSHQGRDGMTTKFCSEYCAKYAYFGVEFGRECFCGTAEEFKAAVSSEKCGVEFASLCTGDATTACGGRNAISVYERNGASPTPSPPTPSPPSPSTDEYSSAGCYVDKKGRRVMTHGESTGHPMSAKICFERCNDGRNTHFGVEYAEECFCGRNPKLTKNGPKVDNAECDMNCSGTRDGEKCGGRNRISAYKIEDASSADPYQGCWADKRSNRAMSIKKKRKTLTTEKCLRICRKLDYTYAGTQYGRECWCGDDFKKHGPLNESKCDKECAGDNSQHCGGYNALSVYKV